MKKFFLLGAAMLALFATSCSNDDIAGNSNEIGTGKTISLNATINNGAETRLTYTDDGNSEITVAWSSEESFTLYKGTSSSGSLFTNTSAATGTFTGPAIDGGNEGDKYYAVYGGNITNNAGKLTIDLSTPQVGTVTENGITDFMLATADALNNETSLEFKHKLTVLKLTLTLPSDVTGTVNKVTVSGLHNKATYNLIAETPAFDYGSDDSFKGDITATNGTTGFEIKATVDGETTKKSFTAYVAVFPEKIFPNQVKITAFVDDNDYSYTIALNEGVSDLQLLENQVVPVQVTLAAPKKNFKSAYTTEDYFYWDAYTYVTNGNKDTFSEDNYGYNTGSEAASHSCASCPTASQMVAYLKAGVYWDNGVEGEGLMTYSAPNGNGSATVTKNSGLWVKKKSVIGDDFYTETDKTYNTNDHKDDGVFKKLSEQTAEEINKIRTGGDYFFLPAAGHYNSGFIAAGSYGFYWSSSPGNDGNAAYGLYFNNSFASVSYAYAYRGIGYLPMVAE